VVFFFHNAKMPIKAFLLATFQPEEPGLAKTKNFFLDGLANAEDFGATTWAGTLSCRLAILHRDLLRVGNVNLFSTLYTICLHFFHLLPKS